MKVALVMPEESQMRQVLSVTPVLVYTTPGAPRPLKQCVQHGQQHARS